MLWVNDNVTKNQLKVHHNFLLTLHMENICWELRRIVY